MWPVAKSSRLLSRAPELDESIGLIRMGGHLHHCADLATDEAHSIVLDSKHPLTRLIIQDYDEKLSSWAGEAIHTPEGDTGFSMDMRQCVGTRGAVSSAGNGEGIQTHRGWLNFHRQGNASSSLLSTRLE